MDGGLDGMESIRAVAGGKAAENWRAEPVGGMAAVLMSLVFKCSFQSPVTEALGA